MSERDNNVYKAKLAEQAERYDGESQLFFKIYLHTHTLTHLNTFTLLNFWAKRRQKKKTTLQQNQQI